MRQPTLLQEIQEVLPQSYLVFLLADLRLMSGTGRIGTKYETIALDSDVCERRTAEQLACIQDDYSDEEDEYGSGAEYDEGDGDRYKPRSRPKQKGPQKQNDVSEGLSPAQIMAVLLLELKHTMDEVQKAKRWNRPVSGTSTSTNEDDQEDRFISYRNTDSKQRRTLEDSMESLLRAYSRMISNDLNAYVPHIHRRQSMISGVSPSAHEEESLTSNNYDGNSNTCTLEWAKGNPALLQSIAEASSESENENTEKNIPDPPKIQCREPSMTFDDLVEEDNKARLRVSPQVESSHPSPALSGSGSPSTKPAKMRRKKKVSQRSSLPQPSVADHASGNDDKKSFANGDAPEGEASTDEEQIALPVLASTPTRRINGLATAMTGEVVSISKSHDGVLSPNHVNEAQNSDEEASVDTKPVTFIFPKFMRRRSTGQSSEDSSLSAPTPSKPRSGPISLHSSMPIQMSPLRDDTILSVPSSPTEGHSALYNSSRARLQALAQEVRTRRLHLAAEWQTRRLEIAEEVKKLIPPNQDSQIQHEFQELTDTLFEMGQEHGDFQSSQGGHSKSPQEMYLHLKTAVESRQANRLNFMSKLFKEGSISQLMVLSSSRIVWMNDWYPLKDLTYAIAVDQKLERVLVVFRGAITKADWRAVTKFAFETVPNPVQESFEGKSKNIKVYTGFYQYLFRKRKDTGTTKYDEIANLAHKYGREKIGKNYKLFVTGHSLGGALTVCMVT